MVDGRTRRSAARTSLKEESPPARASPSEEPSSPAVPSAEDDSLVNAPPESSTDEESDGVGGSASTRGDITSSLFRQTKPRSRKEQQVGRTANGNTQSAQRPRKTPERASRRLSEIRKESRPKVEDISDDDTDAVEEPPKRSAKRGGKPGYGSHLENQVFIRSAVSQKYGTGRIKQFKINKRKAGDEEPPPKKRVRPPKMPKGFIPPDVDDMDSPPKRAQFIVPIDCQTPDTPTGARFKAVDAVFSPPSGNSKKPTFKRSLITDSPLRGTAKFKRVDLDIRDDSGPAGLQKKPQARSQGRGRTLSVSSSSSSLTELDSVLSDGPVLCPMCDAPIDADLLGGLSAITMSIAKQQKICQLHRRREAKAQWKEKGYPTIDWDSLESRFEQQHDYLDKVLKAEAESHYRDVYSRKVESGKGRTLLTSEKEGGGSLTPGYYGFRGARLMSEWLIRRFSAPLRRRAVKDRLVAARGHTTYVQSVLVPELAARLIAEDLGIRPEAARDVLRESARLGELLHEEIRDVVRDEPDEDEDGF